MIRCDKKEECYCIETEAYTLQLGTFPQITYLQPKNTGRLFAWIDGIIESTEEILAPQPWEIMSQSNDCLVLERQEKSNRWEKKTLCLTLRNDSLEYQAVLTGKGKIEQLRYMRPVINGIEYGMSGDIDEVFSTAPNFQDRQYYHPGENVVISYGNELSTRTGGHALASTPHVMALHDRRDDGFLTASIFAEPGQYTWDEMQWNPSVRVSPTGYCGDDCLPGGFAIDYNGKMTVDGTWKSPVLCLNFAENESQVLPQALEYAYTRSFLPRPGQHPHPAWWDEPIYCTWHDQTALATQGINDYKKPLPNPLKEFCTQENTEHWLTLLEQHDCKPGIVILDDKWQCSHIRSEANTELWPDLRGWIDSCHRRNVRVFLWWLAWQPEEITAEEAITDSNGKILCGDPTNPIYEQRLRKMLHQFFSDGPDGLNADGVKIVGLLSLPTGKGLKNHANLWGLELQRRLLEICHDEAHKTKAEACVSLFTANPYLDEFTDMVRLGDMYTWRLGTIHTAQVRTDICRATLPHVPIDTDGQLMFNLCPDYLSALYKSVEMGIPTVYNAEFLRRLHFFLPAIEQKLDDKDYKAFAEVFRKYRESLNS